MAVLTRADIEQRARDRRMETREIEGLGTVNILRLNGNVAKDMADYQKKLLDDGANALSVFIDMRIAIIAKCWADENGERMYGDDEQDAEAIRQLLNDDIAALANECLRVNGMSQEEADKALGKSSTTGTGDSPSSSA